MYIYLACRGLTGLFAGSQPVVASLIADIWEKAKPEVKVQKNMLIMFPLNMFLVERFSIRQHRVHVGDFSNVTLG